MEKTRFSETNCYLKCLKGHYSKITQTSYGPLQSGHDFITETATCKVQTDITKNISKSYGSCGLHVQR